MPLSVTPTPIAGLFLVDLVVHGDRRGWFKENWQREKMVALGLPDFRPVQNNISWNAEVGTTRGIHAEPWNKFVSVATGRIYGAWVDLRAGDGFGRVVTAELGPDRAVFVPRGVGNAYQTLEPDTAYTYLVDDHWSAQAEYTFLHLGDETAAIAWPIPLAEAVLSDKDRSHPRLADVRPFQARPALVLGAGGQLGTALRSAFPHGDFRTRAQLDITDPDALDTVRWRDYALVVNAAAYTKVDLAETPTGRVEAWAANATAVAALARRTADAGVPLVTVSSDYVFDGTRERHDEAEPLSPLGVYGQSKAAGDVAAATNPRHWIVRTSWVVGDGRNFVRTMADLAARGADPAVVDDQFGRLAFADEIARGIRHLVDVDAPYGVYHLSNDGDAVSWAEVARAVFAGVGADQDRVTTTSTEAYAAGRPVAPRPRHSTLDLAKLRATGFVPRDWREQLSAYLQGGVS